VAVVDAGAGAIGIVVEDIDVVFVVTVGSVTDFGGAAISIRLREGGRLAQSSESPSCPLTRNVVNRLRLII
jgi:hypothetical protein